MSLGWREIENIVVSVWAILVVVFWAKLPCWKRKRLKCNLFWFWAISLNPIFLCFLPQIADFLKSRCFSDVHFAVENKTKYFWKDWNAVDFFAPWLKIGAKVICIQDFSPFLPDSEAEIFLSVYNYSIANFWLLKFHIAKLFLISQISNITKIWKLSNFARKLPESCPKFVLKFDWFIMLK